MSFEMASDRPPVLPVSNGEPDLSPPCLAPQQIEDGRYFAWIDHIMPWSEPCLQPQLILDVNMHQYVLDHNKNIRLIAKHVLPVEHYDLTLDELRVRYPAPEWHQHDDREREGSVEL